MANKLVFEFENVSPPSGTTALGPFPEGSEANLNIWRNSLIFDGGSVINTNDSPLSHGVRRDCSPGGGVKGGALRSRFK